MKFKLITTIFFILIFSSSSPAQSNESLTNLDERLTNLELAQFKDKLDFGLEFISVIGHYDIKDRNPDNTTGDYTGQDTDERNRMASIIRLNANAKINSQISLYSQFEANFRSNSAFLTGNVPDFDSNSQRKGIFTVIKRAYFDFHAYPWLTLSMGRLPTTNGPPSNLRNNQPRQGTYPLSSFSSPIDGVAASFKWDINSKTRLAWRSIFAPGSSSGDTSDQTYGSYQVLTSATNGRLLDDSQGATTMFELRNKSSWWNEFLFIAQYSHYSIGGLRDAFFDNIDNGEGLPVGRYRLSSVGNRLADIGALSTYLQIDNFNLSFFRNIKFYFGHTYTKLKRRGSLKLTQAASPFTDVSEFGFISNEDISGNRWMTGGTYTFSNRQFLGLEYMYATDKAIPVSSYDDELHAVTGEIGRDIHLFYGIPFGNFQSVARFGAHHFKQHSQIPSNTLVDSSLKYNLFYMLFDFMI